MTGAISFSRCASRWPCPWRCQWPVRQLHLVPYRWPASAAPPCAVPMASVCSSTLCRTDGQRLQLHLVPCRWPAPAGSTACRAGDRARSSTRCRADGLALDAVPVAGALALPSGVPIIAPVTRPGAPLVAVLVHTPVFLGITKVLQKWGYQRPNRGTNRGTKFDSIFKSPSFMRVARHLSIDASSTNITDKGR